MYFYGNRKKNENNFTFEQLNEMCKYIFDNKSLIFSDLMIKMFTKYNIKNTGKLLSILSKTKSSLILNTRKLLLHMYNDEYNDLTVEERDEYELFKSMSYEEFESYNSNIKIDTEAFTSLKNKSMSDFRVKKCVDLYLSGISIEDIAKELSISEFTLKKDLRENLPKETNLYINFLIYDNKLTPINVDDCYELYDYFYNEYRTLLLSSHKYSNGNFSALKKTYENILSLLKFEDVKIQEKNLDVLDKEKVLLIKNLLLINKIRKTIIQNDYMSDSKKAIAIKKYDLKLNLNSSPNDSI